MARLIPFADSHLPELMGWFPDRRSCAAWGGPRFRFPFTAATFREDLQLPEMASRGLVDESGELLGFGQFYLRTGRCHLARLAIRPEARRGGLGSALVGELCRVGRERLGVEQCSLFVLADNAPALALYRKMGFVPEPYPGDDMDLDSGSMLYMVTQADASPIRTAGSPRMT